MIRESGLLFGPPDKYDMTVKTAENMKNSYTPTQRATLVDTVNYLYHFYVCTLL